MSSPAQNCSQAPPKSATPEVQAKIVRLLLMMRDKGKRQGWVATKDRCCVKLVRLGLNARVPVAEFKQQLVKKKLLKPLLGQIIRILKNPHVAEKLRSAAQGKSISWPEAVRQTARIRKLPAAKKMVPVSTTAGADKLTEQRSELDKLCTKLLDANGWEKGWEMDCQFYLLKFTPKTAGSAAKGLTWDPPAIEPSSLDTSHGVWIEPGQQASEELARLADLNGLDRAKVAAELIQRQMPAVELLLSGKSLTEPAN